LASGKKLTSPIHDPGGLAVSMKLSSSINRLAGAQNNVQNAISFLEVQDGMLDSVGKIIDRMSELKGLASQDPMKSEQDRASYNNEFKDLQIQLYDISKMEFNGVSLFANHQSTAQTGVYGSEAIFNAQNQELDKDNTLTIYTSGDGSSGSKVSVNKSLLLSALTLSRGLSIGKGHSLGITGNKTATASMTNTTVITFASESVGGTLSLGQISVGVISQALENISYLRSQNGGVHSRLAFNLESLGQQKTNMRAALGRIVDVDIAEESMNLAKYTILNQAAASMLAQANASSDVALMLLR
jgi:flagellin